MRTLIDESQLDDGVSKLAKEIDATYGDRPITVVAVMTGSLVLFADLIRRLSMPQRVGVIHDIYDTGATLTKLSEAITEMGAASVSTAVLLRKQRPDQIGPRPDFVAFEIPDEFVVGYGLDYLDMYRNLPFIGVLEPDEIEATARQ